MRAILCTDTHITDNKPEYRTDDEYHETCFRKLEWILQQANEFRANIVLHAGDVFENHYPADYLVRRFLQLINEYNIKFLFVPGNHDQRNHTADITNTTVGILAEHPDIDILNDRPIKYDDEIAIYGSAWNSDVPEIDDFNKFNILVTHRMIVDDKLYDGQENFVYSKNFLRKHKFNLIVSGDNHKSFEILGSRKSLINSGSMMRSRTDQGDHKPCIWKLDTNSDTMLEKKYIPIEAFKDVMDLKTSEEDKSKDKKLDEYIAELKTSKVKIQGFLSTLDYIITKNKIESGVVDFINQCKEKV